VTPSGPFGQSMSLPMYLRAWRSVQPGVLQSTHQYQWPAILSGRLLLFIRPAGLCGLSGDLAPSSVGERFQSAFSANTTAFLAHLRHNLRDDRQADGLGRLRVPYRGHNDTTGVLDGIQLGLSNPLRHEPRSHGQGRFVKLEGISN